MIDVTEAELREGLAASLAVPRWVDDVVARAPFESLAQLLEVASDAATPLDLAEIDEAIAHHPRIGEKPASEGTAVDKQAQAFSRSEQASLGDDDDAQVNAEIAAGNLAYEERFGRVFIIRAAGRTRAEILEELTRRLELPNSTELEIVGEQLRDIALLRIEKLWGDTE
ncbi:2-oxo-4-hydroxy-4-carboxy-5-ureidoimidazoline decarboxylase [soil metagenome]